MYFKILLAYILGYVNIEVEGYFIERFINICNHQKIVLWNSKRIRTTIMRANVSLKDFKKLKPILKKTKCRLKIRAKKGFPFLSHRYHKRKVFFIFFILLILATCLLSNFIWNIEITGNETIPTSEIEEILKENNFQIGKLKQTIHTNDIISQIRLQRNDIAWVGIEIKGTNAEVKVVEADKKPEIIAEDEYCNLIATKDGMIVKISAQNGTPVVKEGDIVTKGSVLVGGWLEGKYTGMRYVHANGEVQAKVWYSKKVEIPLQDTKKQKTGAQENKFSVKINNFEINLSKRVSKFKNYDTIEDSKKLRLFSNFYLPIEIHKFTYEEYENQEITHTVEEAKQIGIEKAKEALKDEVSQEQTVLNERVNTKEKNNSVEVEVIYEILENIVTKEKIVFEKGE